MEPNCDLDAHCGHAARVVNSIPRLHPPNPIPEARPELLAVQKLNGSTAQPALPFS